MPASPRGFADGVRADGTMYMTVSGAIGRIENGSDPRKLDTVYGKVIRLRDEEPCLPTTRSSASQARSRRFSPWAIAISSASRHIQ